MLQCPKCSAPLDTVELYGGVKVESCPSCFGAFYRAAQIVVPLVWGPLAQSAWTCPDCGAPLETGTVCGGKLTLDTCVKCRGIWFDAGEINKLRELAGVEGVVGAQGAADLMHPEAAAGLAAHTEDRISKAAPAGAGASPAWPPPRVPPPTVVTDNSLFDNADALRNPSVAYEGRTYAHFQTSRPVVGYVLGEFNWRVKVGQEATARDFICPPYILSEEATKEDSVWNSGEYVDPAEIKAAFNLESLPNRIGVAPNQPNPYSEDRNAVLGSFFIALAVCLGLGFFISTNALNKTVYSGSFAYAASEPEKSKVTPIFELGGHTSNVQVRINTSLDNHWGYFDLALINVDTEEALDFGREVSYYHGYDSDGSWTEGAQYNEVYVPQVKPGNYYIRIEPSETDAASFSYNVDVTRDVPRELYLFVALALLALPAAWYYALSRNFEQTRWAESDHPWTTGSSDDDD